MVHVDLIGSYSKSIIQQHLGGAIIKNNISIKCMTNIDYAMGWFEIVEVPKFDLDKVMSGNNEYIEN